MSTATKPATIEPDVLYRLDAAKQVTGWGVHGMRQARRRGLPVKYLGRFAYVKGADLIDHIEQHGRSEKHGS